MLFDKKLETYLMSLERHVDVMQSWSQDRISRCCSSAGIILILWVEKNVEEALTVYLLSSTSVYHQLSENLLSMPTGIQAICCII